MNTNILSSFGKFVLCLFCKHNHNILSLSGLEGENCNVIYSQLEGATSSEASIKLDLYGRNSIEIELLPIWRLVLDEVSVSFFWQINVTNTILLFRFWDPSTSINSSSAPYGFCSSIINSPHAYWSCRCYRWPLMSGRQGSKRWHCDARCSRLRWWPSGVIIDRSRHVPRSWCPATFLSCLDIGHRLWWNAMQSWFLVRP